MLEPYFRFVSGDFKPLRSELNALRSELAAIPFANRNSMNKAERAKPLRTENRSCKFKLRDLNLRFTDNGSVEKPCEPNLRIKSVASQHVSAPNSRERARTSAVKAAIKMINHLKNAKF